MSSSRLEAVVASRERILCAAVKYRLKSEDKVRYAVGKRHPDCFRTIGVPTSERVMSEEVQGFLTDSLRFVDRHIAMRVAVSAGQVEPVSTSKTELLSEDLY